MLFVKYSVSAVMLFGVTLMGSIGVVVTSALQGHAQHPGMVFISTVLLWLGLLSVLGLALLFSTLFKNGLLATLLSLCCAIFLLLPGFSPAWRPWNLPGYWASLAAYQGTALPLKEVAVCLLAALLPAGLTFYVFQRRTY
jgi:hypothetical protein